MVCDVVTLQHLTLDEARYALAEVARVMKSDGVFFSYRLSDHSVMYGASDQRWLDVATVANIRNAALPLAGNGPTGFWSPTLVRAMYAEAGLETTCIERIGHTYANGAYVEYLAIQAVVLSKG